MKDKNDIFLQNLNLIVIMQKAVPLPEFQTGEEVSEASASPLAYLLSMPDTACFSPLLPRFSSLRALCSW